MLNLYHVEWEKENESIQQKTHRERFHHFQKQTSKQLILLLYYDRQNKFIIKLQNF